MATIYCFKLCLYDEKLIFICNLEYMKYHYFVPVNLIVCCDNLLLQADIMDIVSLPGIMTVYCTVFFMNISLQIEGN